MKIYSLRLEPEAELSEKNGKSEKAESKGDMWTKWRGYSR